MTWTESRRQDSGDHFLDRGFAVAAGNANQGQGELAPPVLRDLAQRDARIGDHQRRNRQSGRHMVHHHGCGAIGSHRIEEIVGVEALAAQRDEQHAWRYGAAIG